MEGKLFLLFAVLGLAIADDPPYSEPETEAGGTVLPILCDYPDIDFLSDRIIERLAYSESSSILPYEYKMEDDNEGKLNAKDIVIYGLNKFARVKPSTYKCTDEGLTITIPIKWQEGLKSDFEVAPGFTRNPSFYVKASGEIKNMEADLIIDVVFVGDPVAHVRSIDVTTLSDVELGPRGYNAFARAVRRMISFFGREFKTKMTMAVEMNLQEILDKEMVKINLEQLGFQ